MRVVLNESIKTFSGKLSEIQFTVTKYGLVGGKAATLNDPKTPAQKKQRGTLGRSSQLFGQLDLEKVQLWRDYAKTLRFVDKKSGARYAPDAIAVYNSLADRWLAAHNGVGTPPSSPPTASYGVPGLPVQAVASGGFVTFSSDDAAPDGSVIEFWLQRLPKATRLPSKGGYRVVGYSALPESGGNEFRVPVKPGAYVAKYRCISLSTGQATELIDLPVSGVALAVEQGGASERPAAKRKAA